MVRHDCDRVRRRYQDGIPGLRTATDAFRELQMHEANSIIVKIQFDIPEEVDLTVSIPATWLLVARLLET